MVDYGYDIHELRLSGRTYSRITAGKAITKKGQGFSWDGRPDQDYWDFNLDSPGSLHVHTADRGEIYEGNMDDDEVSVWIE